MMDSKRAWRAQSIRSMVGNLCMGSAVVHVGYGFNPRSHVQRAIAFVSPPTCCDGEKERRLHVSILVQCSWLLISTEYLPFCHSITKSVGACSIRCLILQLQGRKDLFVVFHDSLCVLRGARRPFPAVVQCK